MCILMSIYDLQRGTVANEEGTCLHARLLLNRVNDLMHASILLLTMIYLGAIEGLCAATAILLYTDETKSTSLPELKDQKQVTNK